MRKFFLTFASSNIKNSLPRIKSQATNLNFYDEIFAFTESDLDQNFRAFFKDKLKFAIRGFGYWCWKPQIILQTLSKMEDGDILQYTDAGCHLNYEGKVRLAEYFEIVRNDPKGVIAFQQKPPEFYDGRHLNYYMDSEYTKGDLIKFFKLQNNKALINSPTIGAGVIFIRKCKFSNNLINEWLNVFYYDFRLADDSESIMPNLKNFIEHRHDQAIFSLLCKVNNVSTLSAFEYWYPKKNTQNPDWLSLTKFPIHAKRDKGFSFYRKILSFAKRKLRIFNLYI